MFFLHNRVESIQRVGQKIMDLVPEARVTVAHGQMPPAELKKNMGLFQENEAQVLVCSAIIESGLDYPNANTIIINRADRFGLAQLYQLRGRVGRSSRRAYAYLLLPGSGTVTRDAEKRLRGAAGAGRAGQRLQAGAPRPGNPRRRQPAGARAVGPDRRGGLRAVHPDDGGDHSRAEGGGAPGQRGAGDTPGHPRLLPGRLHPQRQPAPAVLQAAGQPGGRGPACGDPR